MTTQQKVSYFCWLTFGLSLDYGLFSPKKLFKKTDPYQRIQQILDQHSGLSTGWNPR